MTEQTGAQLRLTAYQFTVCLLAAVARRGFVSFLAPRSDHTHVSDVAASAAWKYMQKNDNGEFDYRFRLYTHSIYRYSEDWQNELVACEPPRLIVLLTPEAARSDRFWYRLENDRLQRLSTTFPGSQVLWDDVANVFIETIEKEDPFALAGAPLSW